jgi:hypothetical protein
VFNCIASEHHQIEVDAVLHHTKQRLCSVSASLLLDLEQKDVLLFLSSAEDKISEKNSFN